MNPEDVATVVTVVLGEVFLVLEDGMSGSVEPVGELLAEFVPGGLFPLVGAFVGVEALFDVLFLDFVPGILGWVFGWHF